MLHYHGLPITPRIILEEAMCPNNFVISMADDRDSKWAIRNAQSILWDSGAWSAYSRGHQIDWNEYYKWLENKMFHPHFAIAPDIINGTVEEQKKLLCGWPYKKEHSAVVYHFGEPLDRLRELMQIWPKIAIGGSVGIYNPGTEAFASSLDAIFECVAKSGCATWFHALRFHDEASRGHWGIASADSANWARNHNSMGNNKWHKLHDINRTNPDIHENYQQEFTL
jgi:hypothetical protein